MRLFADQSFGGKAITLQSGDEVLIECPNGRAWLMLLFGVRTEISAYPVSFRQDSPAGDNKFLLDAHDQETAHREVNDILAPLGLQIGPETGRDNTYIRYTLIPL
ncbi:hypothetical protein COV05_04215 [Candidatus Uhrbacteria bacterium CG10_big_fil_rev_8_21_14_0_10_48_16]|uniref:Uncharacterized protein n=1 Tax=Candidatus Uhrbacteria bacterium CG10_big_fil_rev_8_21_14_0_10_48_16 TaxID=1975038 RepID=A0A2M8LGM0_9BACT|nr:MAG: hypothetical protein COV05_04215 [Candidatus Uhrbacteria bacterium CG10_big_fil_rev_8_21_14_0_10_48_16]